MYSITKKVSLTLTNFRSISFLNTNYKSIANVLFTHLQTIVSSFISDNQTGYDTSGKIMDC